MYYLCCVKQKKQYFQNHTCRTLFVGHDVAVGYEDMLDHLLCWHLILTPFLCSSVSSGHSVPMKLGVAM